MPRTFRPSSPHPPDPDHGRPRNRPLKADGIILFDALGQQVVREPLMVTWDSEAAEKGGYEHFMMKEIHEEPRAVRDTIMPRMRDGKIRFESLNLDRKALESLDRIRIVACGTASHAGMVGKYVIESLCRIPVEVDVASEFRYRNPIITDRTLTIIISQSGETLDTLAAMREAKSLGSADPGDRQCCRQFNCP